MRFLKGMPPLPTAEELRHTVRNEKLKSKDIAQKFNMRWDTLALIFDYDRAIGGKWAYRL
jgi:hypothetical protein